MYCVVFKLSNCCVMLTQLLGQVNVHGKGTEKFLWHQAPNIRRGRVFVNSNEENVDKARGLTDKPGTLSVLTLSRASEA